MPNAATQIPASTMLLTFEAPLLLVGDEDGLVDAAVLVGTVGAAEVTAPVGTDGTVAVALVLDAEAAQLVTVKDGQNAFA